MPDLMTIAGIALKTSLLIVVGGIVVAGAAPAIGGVSPSAVDVGTRAVRVDAACRIHASVAHDRDVVGRCCPRPDPPPHAGEALGRGDPDLDRRQLVFPRARAARPALVSRAGDTRRTRSNPRVGQTTLAKFDCRVRVLESQHIASPCTWGVLTPVLLLPTAGDAWSESARHSALLHELAHVRRRDTVSALISRLACALHWYNPLVWLAAAHARNLQERACDDAVLRAGAIPSDYAQFLLDVAAHVSGVARPNRSAIGMAHSSLRARIVAILDPEAMRSQAGRAPILASCAALFTIAVLLGMASVEYGAAAAQRSGSADGTTSGSADVAEIAEHSPRLGPPSGGAGSACRAGDAGNTSGESRIMKKKLRSRRCSASLPSCCSAMRTLSSNRPSSSVSGRRSNGSGPTRAARS